jgi:hypothetical protein
MEETSRRHGVIVSTSLDKYSWVSQPHSRENIKLVDLTTLSFLLNVQIKRSFACFPPDDVTTVQRRSVDGDPDPHVGKEP